MSDESKESPVVEVSLPPTVEAQIALDWSDNPAAAQLNRTIARAMLAQDIDPERVRERIATNGRVVD